MLLPMAVHAEAPGKVQADFSYVPTGCAVERWVLDNQLLLACGDTGDWYQGDFLGSSTEVYNIAFYGSEGNIVYKYGFYQGRVTFTGTVRGKTGTLDLLFVGTSPGDIADWSGRWRILGGTDELGDVHGAGVFHNNSDDDGNKIPLNIHIEGRIFFDL
jgi:hypothetical protein